MLCEISFRSGTVGDYTHTHALGRVAKAKPFPAAYNGFYPWLLALRSSVCGVLAVWNIGGCLCLRRFWPLLNGNEATAPCIRQDYKAKIVDSARKWITLASWIGVVRCLRLGDLCEIAFDWTGENLQKNSLSADWVLKQPESIEWIIMHAVPVAAQIWIGRSVKFITTQIWKTKWLPLMVSID